MKLNLTTRQTDILKMILLAFNPINIESLCFKYKKLPRSIHYDISIIKKELADIDVCLKSKQNTGFYIPTKQKQFLIDNFPEMQNIDDELVDSEATRLNNLFIYISIQKDPVTAQNLADHLYLSRSTVMRLIDKFNQSYNKAFIVKTVRSKGYVLDGDEFKIRQQLVTLIYDKLKNDYSINEWYSDLPKVIQRNLTLNELETIILKIKKLNSKYNVWLTNYSFVKMLIYCIICIKRCEIINHDRVDASTYIENYSNELLIELLQTNKLADSEIDLMEAFVKEFEIYVSNNNSNNFEIDVILGEIITYLSKNPHNYSFDIGSLYVDLKEHFNRFVNINNQFEDTCDNKVLNEIKTKYTPYYDLAKQCASYFNKHSKIILSEMEIAYIGIYLYKNRNEKTEKKRVLVVCATGKGVSHLISSKIKNIFHNIEIIDQVSPYQLENIHQYNSVDFIISNIPIKDSVIPVIKVSSTLTKNDVQRIENFIEYGEFVDSIPFNNKNSASINSNDETNQYFSNHLTRNNIIESSQLIANIYLELIDNLYKLPKQYQPSKETLLGLYMHIILAIPRWYENNDGDESTNQLYFDTVKDFPLISEVLEKLFNNIEKLLYLELSPSEKYAFYVYLLNGREEAVNEENTY